MPNPTDIQKDFLNSQNNQLNAKIKTIEEETTTNNQKINYMLESIHTYKQINYYLFILYYIFVIIVAYKLFRSKNGNIYMNVFYLLCFSIFPYVIYPLEINIYNLVLYIYAFINGNIYSSNNIK